ncbi:Stage III sporulation protein AF [Paenibacillus solanacearum]|uniref:Stage III sporulation protein AF n=1 Tax=Paenibacillus solanacearum TaxID=2048548 RepID=A0A916K0J1_9BACL|nr:stage III sporulation protein AF [Paenibacillus solanacearum]CAG7612468.1 Stage III sporulation protein AF [Paenibacillus solanacearum]
MEWLSGWLKTVILVILLATFVDLLLPNHTMQRYVKTVMSLFLLLTLLQPLLSLFEKHTQIEEALSGSLFKEGSRLLGAGSAATLQPLPEIQQRAELLRNRQQQEARRIAETQAADLMKRKIEQAAGVKVQRVQVETAADDNGQWIIKHVSVSVDPAARAASGTDSKRTRPAAAMEPVKPVEPVIAPDIRVGPNAAKAVPVARLQGGDAEQWPPDLLQKKTQIQLMLEQDWQLSPAQIALTIEQGG